MDRVIKFRYVMQHTVDKRLWIPPFRFSINEIENGAKDLWRIIRSGGWQIYAREQYTELKDKNGEEAYHKDKVSALGYSNWIIEWYNNGWKLKQEDIENYQEIPDDFIIIGNIYENPELLKEK